MASTWYRNIGDSGPALTAILKRDGNPIDLATATLVQLRISRKRDRGRAPSDLISATFGSRPDGEVTFAGIGAYTSDVSQWLIQWVVTDGTVATYPSDGTTMVLVVSG